MTLLEGTTAPAAFRSPGTAVWRELLAGDAADKDQQAVVRRAKEELKNVLLASLQMQHLVVLAGSGCSRSAGGPSMQDLWNGAVGEKPTDSAKAIAKSRDIGIWQSAPTATSLITAMLA